MFQTAMGLDVYVLAAALLVAAVREARWGDYPDSLPVAFSLWFVVKALSAQGPSGGILAVAGFAGGVCMLAAPALFGKVRARHVLLFGMIGTALGPEALFTVFLFTCLAWCLCRMGVRLKRIMLRKRLFRNIYCSSRFVLAGQRDMDLFFDEKGPAVTRSYGPIISLGAVSALLWHMSGYGYLVVL